LGWDWLKWKLFSVAEVAITLKNEGLDAYRPDIYGNAIRIARRFTDKGKFPCQNWGPYLIANVGSSSYTIKGAKDKFKKTISSKKEELTNITDHMNLQVRPPLLHYFLAHWFEHYVGG
jgi:hypothetical protein